MRVVRIALAGDVALKSCGGRMRTKNVLALTAFLALGTSLMAVPACPNGPTLVTAAVTCEIGNMIFSNFTTGGSPDLANLTVTYGITNLGQTNYVVNFNDSNDMTSSFTVSYTETVDEATFPATTTNDGKWAVVAIGGGMQADGTTPNNQAILTKNVTAGTGSTGSGQFTVVQNNSLQTNNGPLTGLQDKNATILDTFSYTSGGIQNISNSFTEADTSVPEPGALLLMGFGLSVVGLVSRRVVKGR
jgi:hypothetical protein